MTTIAYRDGVMVADTRAYGFDKVPVGHKTKIEMLDGMLFGCSSGTVGVPDAVRKWIKKGMNLKKVCVFNDCPGFHAIVVMPDGTAKIFDENWHPSELRHEYYAIGSGKNFALAILYDGGTAEQAVKTACAFDPWSGGPLTTLSHMGKV